MPCHDDGRARRRWIVLEGPLHYLKTVRDAAARNLDAVPDGHVRQHFMESADEGKNWTDWFNGYYSRVRD